MTRRLALVAAIVALGGCGGSDGGSEAVSTEGAAGGNPRTDKLAQVLARGTLVLSTDLEYPPQSYRVKRANRRKSTKCQANQLTAPEVSGYDAETGKLVAEALGVEPCFVTPLWTEITGGDWGDRWDISYGSGSINAERMRSLYMTQPYYATPAHFYVRAGSEVKSSADLAGKKIGACASCSHEEYLNGKLKIPGQRVKLSVNNPEVVTFDVESSGLAAVAKGKIDAFLCQEPVGAQAIDDGLRLRPLKSAAFYLYPSGFVDKGSGLRSAAFVDRVDEIVAKLHSDGELAKLSEKHFGENYADKAAGFDIASIDQQVR